MKRTIVYRVLVLGCSVALACTVGIVLPPGVQPASAAEWSSERSEHYTTDADSSVSSKGAAYETTDPNANAPATESKTGATGESAATTAMPMDVIQASKLQNMKLMGLQNEELGRVHDVILTTDLSNVSYIAMQRGGVMGVGEKLYAIPWSAVSMSADGKTLSASISKTDLESTQGFDRKSWPDKGDAKWSSATGRTPTAMGMDPDSDAFRLRRLSETLKTDVRNRSDADLGKLSDLGVDKPSGRVIYGIISWGGLGKKESQAAVPWDMFVLQPRPRVAMIDTDSSTLQTVAFEMSDWKSLSSRSYADKVYQQFGEEPYWQVYGYPKVDEQLTSTESWLPGSDYNKKFDTSTISTMQAKVDSTGTFRPMSHAVSGLRLKVTTADDKTMTVHCGPKDFISQQGFTFKKGDSVTVTGSRVQMGKHTILMATSIEISGRTLNLRDSQGKPMWTKDDLTREMSTKGEKKVENEMPSSGSRGMGY